MLERMGQIDEAVAAAREATTKEPANWRLGWCSRGSRLAGRRRGSVEAYEKAQSLFPARPIPGPQEDCLERRQSTCGSSIAPEWSEAGSAATRWRRFAPFTGPGPAGAGRCTGIARSWFAGDPRSRPPHAMPTGSPLGRVAWLS